MQAGVHRGSAFRLRFRSLPVAESRDSGLARVFESVLALLLQATPTYSVLEQIGAFSGGVIDFSLQSFQSFTK